MCNVEETRFVSRRPGFDHRKRQKVSCNDQMFSPSRHLVVEDCKGKTFGQLVHESTANFPKERVLGE